MEQMTESFRPLSGNLIFQLTTGEGEMFPDAFPSPVGESYFSIPPLPDSELE